MRVVTAMLALAVSLAIVGNLWAAEEKKAPERGRPGPGGFMGGPMLLDQIGKMKGMNLTDEQKTKLEALKKEYDPKLKEAHDKMDSILTPEQKKARDEAMKARDEAIKAGKSARDAREGFRGLKLTDEQREKMGEAMKAAQPLQREVREKVMEILTKEQKELLKQQRPQGPERRRPRQEK
jgi:Spy/CpxP family protein refolding chaperone